MSLFSLLLAKVDIGDVIQLIVLLLIFVIPVVSQLFAKIKQIPPPEKRPLPPRTRMPDIAQEFEPNIVKEMEKFFQGDFQGDAEERPPARRESRVIQKPVKKRQPSQAKSGAQATQAASQAAPAQVVSAQPLGAKLDQHVSDYLDEKQFSERETSLGQGITKTGQEIKQRLHQTFDYQMSALESVPGVASGGAALAPVDIVTGATEMPALFTTGLIDMLTDPESLRQVIILNEVLRRPEEHWRV